MNKRLAKRFIELEEQMRGVANTQADSHSDENVDANVFLEWRVKVKNLIVKVCGEKSEHYKEFTKVEERRSASIGNLSKFKALKAVFSATKEDFEGGYLSSYKAIVQAEIFDTELEQAHELLKGGYYVAAAVISGVVLETTLRELCDREGIESGTMNTMNANLAKAGVYNKNVQKKITAYAGIRNSAAHGNQDEFTKVDVEQMILGIEQFLATNLDG